MKVFEKENGKQIAVNHSDRDAAVWCKKFACNRPSAIKIACTLAAARFSDSNVKRIIICNSCIDLLKLGGNSPVEPAYPIRFLMLFAIVSICRQFFPRDTDTRSSASAFDR